MEVVPFLFSEILKINYPYTKANILIFNAFYANQAGDIN